MITEKELRFARLLNEAMATARVCEKLAEEKGWITRDDQGKPVVAHELPPEHLAGVINAIWLPRQIAEISVVYLPIATEGRSIREVCAMLGQRLRALDLEPCEYLSSGLRVEEEKPWDNPFLRRVHCSAVRGGSEGYYAHIIGEYGTGQSETLILAKCYSRQRALDIARVASLLLDC